MIETGAYAERMAGYLHIAQSPINAKLGSGESEIAVTRLHAPNGFSEPTSCIPLERPYSIPSASPCEPMEGACGFLGSSYPPASDDLEQNPIAFFPNPIDVAQFYIPRRALEEFAYENRIAAINALSWPHCEMDVTLRHLGVSVLTAVQQERPAPKIFLDHIGNVILAHATYVYEGVTATPDSARGHLAPWQVRRAKELLDANLHGDVSLATIAGECNLSVSHFSHAFRRTFGRPPHRWLLEHRIELVKDLLLTSRLTLAEIANKCGFADQPALNRSFKRIVLESPGAWRRSRKGHL